MDTTHAQGVAISSSETKKLREFSKRGRHSDGIMISGEERTTFAPVLANIDMDAISKFASTTRKSGHPSTASMLPEVNAARRFKPCTVNPVPFSGSYNIVFAIEFTDGVVWMLKIPSMGHGQSFDELASKALVSEARTMQMIKKTTSIPIPIVYAFDASLDNDLKVPFILMERIDGMPLYKGWFNEDGRSKAQLEKFRARALQTLAMAMSQLNRFMLNYGGSLVFDTEGKAIGVAGAKTPDANAMWYSNDRTEDDDVFCEKGPFTDPKSALLFMLDRRPSIPKDDVYLKGIDVLLRTFIGWAYEGADRGPRFVLTHPDFDIQNILVAEDGTLRGLIDWDGVAAVPREVGCASFPLWLMHDYIETQYDYDVLAAKPRKEAGYDESSPDELSCYRAVYAQFMEQGIAINTKGMATTNGNTSKEEADLTRRSLVMRNLDIATNDPMVAPDIVDHILALIVDLTETDKEDKKSDSELSSSKDSFTPVKMMEFNGDGTSFEDTQGSSNSSRSPGNIYGDGESTKSKVSEIHNENKNMVAYDSVLHDENKPIVRSTSEFAPLFPKEGVTEKREHQVSVKTHGDKNESVSQGWATTLLRWSYETAKEGLKRLAKIGHVGSNKDNEELVEPEAAHTNIVMMREIRHISKLNTQQKDNEDRCREESKPKFAKNLLPQVTMGSSYRRESGSTPSGLEVEWVLAKKVEEVEEAEWRKVANHAESKTEMEDEKIWERIAFDVRECGVPVELLRKHELQITSRIIDTIIYVLRAEEQQDQNLSADVDTPSKTEADSAALEMADHSAADAEPEGVAAKPPHTDLSLLINQELADHHARMPGSWPDSSCAVANKHQGSPEQSTNCLRDLYRHGASYLKRILSGSTAPQKRMHCLASDDILRGRKGEVFQYNESKLLSSSVRFLSNDEVNASTSEGLNETHPPSDFIDISDQEEVSTVKSLAGNIRSSRSSTRTDAAASGVSVKPSEHMVTGDEKEVEVEVINNDTGKGEEHIDSEDKDLTADHDGDDVSDTSSEGRDNWPPKQPEFEDGGLFDCWTIINVLGKGDLDQVRMLRLKEGFFKLLEQC